MNTFDYIVIGAGSSGIASAIRASELGAKVAIIEGHTLGGNYHKLGNIQKKILFHASWLSLSLKDAKAYGFNNEAGQLDWQQFLQRRRDYISQEQRKLADKLTQHQLTLIKGMAELIDANTVTVAGHTYQAKHFVLAAGTKTLTPTFPGAELAMSEQQIFDYPTCPKAMLIIGSKHCAVEIAAIFAGLGVDVTLAFEEDHILPEFEPELAQGLQDHLKTVGLHILANTSIDKLEKRDGQISAHYGEAAKTVDVVVCATGKHIATHTMGLQNIGIKYNDKGFIQVNDQQETSVTNIYAVGDITGRPSLMPLANRQGIMLAERLFGRTVTSLPKVIPSVVFAHPPLASAGLTEAEAIAQYGKANIKIYRKKFIALYTQFTEIQAPYLIKWISVGEDEKIIGCHALGLGADEIIQGFAAAMEQGITRQQLLNTLAIHPSCAEEWLAALKE